MVNNDETLYYKLPNITDPNDDDYTIEVVSKLEDWA